MRSITQAAGKSSRTGLVFSTDALLMESTALVQTLVMGCYHGRAVGVRASKCGAPAVAMTVQTLAHNQPGDREQRS